MRILYHLIVLYITIQLVWYLFREKKSSSSSAARIPTSRPAL
jgi:hypothetical protein